MEDTIDAWLHNKLQITQVRVITLKLQMNKHCFETNKNKHAVNLDPTHGARQTL